MDGITPQLLALQLFTGLALGAIYVLLAVGLSLIFGMLTVVNFAHGAFFMLGAYVGLFAVEKTSSFWAALVIAPLVVAAIGMLCERWLIRPLYGRGIDYPLLLTFGLAYMMVEAVRIVFGKAGMPFDTPSVRVSVGRGLPFATTALTGQTASGTFPPLAVNGSHW